MHLHLGGHLNWYDARKRARQEIGLDRPTRLADLLDRLNVPPGEVALTIVNGQLVELHSAVVADHDRVEVYPPIGGG
jgi:sulfur carrier protein ThiS